MVIHSDPYSVGSARHHFRNYLGIIRGFSEIYLETFPVESAISSHFVFMIERVDQVQKFIDRVFCSEEILQRQEWKKPFWIEIDMEMRSILKTVEALQPLISGDLIQRDLSKIANSAQEILKFSEDFIDHSFKEFLNESDE